MHGLMLQKLGELPGPLHKQARQFCLDVIKEFYGFDYRREWHGDLDSLVHDAAANHYSSANRGAFWVLTNQLGAVVASAGVRVLSWKPELHADLDSRYPDFAAIGSLWRVYIRQDLRHQGIGRELVILSEEFAKQAAYTHMYLHASTDALSTMEFWKRCGYAPFGEIDFSTHFDKPL